MIRNPQHASRIPRMLGSQKPIILLTAHAFNILFHIKNATIIFVALEILESPLESQHVFGTFGFGTTRLCVG